MRASGLDYTVFKPGVIYGRGDHMLDHLSHALHTFPIFGFVQPLPACDDVPHDLKPRAMFTVEQIRAGLPEPKPFGLADCRWLAARPR